MWKVLALVFNLISFAFALVAAYQWRRSATDMPPPGHVEIGSPDMLIDMKTSLVGMVKLQARWSKRAANNAALAALFQGAALLVQTIAGN